MAPAELADTLRRILRLRPGSTDILSNRESSQLEFKLSFDLRSGPEYARSMAAFANNEGGYLVFGVRNAPHQLVGISRDRFEAVDPVKITDILNSYFSPEIQWDFGLVEFEGRNLGFIYTHEALEKPIVATKSSGNEIKESGVYYRYRGKSTLIKYPELRKIIDDRLNRDRKAWLQHLETISKSGPTKVGIIDTVQGKVFGAGAPFLIDEKLLRQLKFIRQGSFGDTSGAPTLRLIGDLKSVEGVTVEKIVQTGIHYDDLVTAFLAQRQLDADDAKSYLIECAHQTTPYTPIFYFISQANISREDAASLLDAESNTLKNTLSTLKKRLNGTMHTTAFGRIDDTVRLPRVANSRELFEQIMSQPPGIAKRSFTYQALKQYPALVRGIAVEIPCGHLFEAISNLVKHDIERGKAEILGCLLDVFNQRFQTLKGGEKTFFRKAVACVEEQLYG
ncbi:MAG: ATP-binding protein [Thermodesulfobacteriota bacterium]